VTAWESVEEERCKSLTKKLQPFDRQPQSGIGCRQRVRGSAKVALPKTTRKSETNSAILSSERRKKISAPTTADSPAKTALGVAL
jgi:hypothetical protein